MFQPIHEALGRYLGAFYQALAPTTKGMYEFVARGLDKSMVWVPARMVDSADEMLAAWQRNDTDQGPTKPPKLPVILVAVAKDYIPTGRDYGRQVSETLDVIIPSDEEERVFGLRVIGGDIRAQLAICAMDEPTAKSIASQFLLYIDAMENRRFSAVYSFAGQEERFPVQLETPDNPAMNIQTGNKNLTILAIDMTLKASIPLFTAPTANEPNDGKGTPGDATDPAGYPLVDQVDITVKEARP